MSGKINRRISEALRRDDFGQISGYLVESCNLLAENYGQQGRVLPNQENQIRNILLEDYLDNDIQRENHGMQDYRFMAETQEHYDGQGNYIGRADIRIMLKTDFEKRDAYYLVECKRLDGTEDLNNKYIEEGVARFVSRKYSAYYGEAFMLGFVVREIDISDNARKIEKLQNAEVDLRMHGQFEALDLKAVHEMYRCVYHIEGGELELRHIFVNFSRVMV